MRTKKIAAAAAVVVLAAVIIAAVVTQRGNGQATAADRKEVVISAAASLKDGLEDIAALYEQEHPAVDLVMNYGASGTLQKQIEQGAPADLFLSAGEKQMKALETKGLISRRADLLKNELVVVVPSGSGTLASLKELTGERYKRIAVGQPEAVPAGEYARQSLTATGVWEQLDGKLVFVKDVRQVLSYVETGNAEAGLVYRTDALTSDKVDIAAPVEESSHEPILYPAGVIKDAAHESEADAFLEYLESEAAIKIFEGYGFKRP
ncbi:molybdate ABC transporter substrate-binding protein [Paenibacillus sp. CN-4]|uniref:molybdate ABC transporter substrate-binding protein n=1 Tax=Paenibacillus nanchangensis TaxID=3348343 RepID=UPI00397A39A8